MYRCTKGTIVCSGFEVELTLVSEAPKPGVNTNWSMIITIYVGFSIMTLAFLYFEWRTILRCFKRCQDRMCSRASSTAPIHQIEEISGAAAGHGL